MNEMDTDYCDNMQPNVAGATSYFYGIYQRSSDGWRGEEQWILHPTEAWTSTEGETCYVTWSISAEQGEAAGCPSCDFSLEVNGTLDRQQTDALSRRIVGKRRAMVHNLQCFDRRWKLHRVLPK